LRIIPRAAAVSLLFYVLEFSDFHMMFLYTSNYDYLVTILKLLHANVQLSGCQQLYTEGAARCA
jgi:hypothetical protein